MKAFKKKMAAVTALCMIFTLSMPVNAQAATLSDVSNHWANATIQSWIEKDFISGYPDGSFKPENDMKRAEFMTVINKAYGFTSQVAISFADVRENDWYRDPVKIAFAAGYISGFPDGTMRPDDPITREEVAAIISKIKMLEENGDAANNFSDVTQMTWSKGVIGAMVKANIMNGYPDGSFLPQNHIKRGEAVVSLEKASKYNDLPAPPSIIGNDDKDTVVGMTEMMEYKLDSLDWVPYEATAFKKLDFRGNHTLLVRFLATGSIPFSQTTNLIFTAGVPLATSSSGGGGSGGYIADKEISLTTIQGVTVPVTGELPASSITETAQYTGTVAWTPTASAFAAETVYTATITLDPKAGYTLVGVEENAFKVAGATSVANGSGSGVITAIFAATDPVTTEPMVMFSRARITENSSYFTGFGYTNEDMVNIEKVLWGAPGAPSAATYAGVYVESGVYGTSSDGALVINADKITQSLLEWLHRGVWTDGKMALEIVASNGREFYFLENTGTITNTPGATALSMLTATDDNWEGTIIRVDLDDLESNVNFGTILMADGSTTANFEVRVIGSLIPPASISIGAISSTISVNEGTIQMISEFYPSDAYNQTITWRVEDGDPNSVVAAVANSLPRPDILGGYPLGTLVALENGTVTVTAILMDNPNIVSNPFVVTITNQEDSVVPFVPVTSITAVSTTGAVDLPMELSGTVNPSDATNDIIVWSMVSGPATINGNQIIATEAGVVVVKATIINGATRDTDYIQDFTITFTGNIQQPEEMEPII